MYTTRNYKTKKELKEAFRAHKRIEVCDNSGYGLGDVNGECFLEGPHYPAPHTWYARVLVDNNIIVKIFT